MSANHSGFRIGFWHPFGPHGKEEPAKILDRKAVEIEANDGWTLWSFQHRRMLDAWHEQLVSAAPAEVFVFCSRGGGNDPANRGGPAQVADCRSYRFVGDAAWRPIPSSIRVPHTFPFGIGRASAFIVERVDRRGVEPSDLPTIEWLSLGGRWSEGYRSGQRWHSGLPSRGEYLIRAGTVQMRAVAAILKLRAPYLAEVSTDVAS